MDLALLTAKVVLAAVFLVAGVTKLADRRGTRQGIAEFGVPMALAAPFAILLPFVELAVAAALVPAATAWFGALGALGLLVVFLAGIAVNLARGRKPECHCFGQLYSRPVGWTTLIRNALLALVAGFVVARGPAGTGPGLAESVAAFAPAEPVALVVGFVALALLAFQGWFLINLLRQHGRLLLRVEELERRVLGEEAASARPEAPAAPAGLPVGAPAPGFSLAGLYGETLTLDALRAAAKPVLLVFADPGCGPCTALLPEVGGWQREHATKVTTAVITTGSLEANRARAAEHGLTNVLMQRDREVIDAYQAQGTPSAVIVNADGSIGSVLAEGPDAVRELATRTLGTISATSDSPLSPESTAGVRAPQADVDGQDHSSHRHGAMLASTNGPASSGHTHDAPGTLIPANTPGHDVAEPHIHPAGDGHPGHSHAGHSHAADSGQEGCPDPVPVVTVPIGESAPHFALPDLTGQIRTLAEFRGRTTAILFWNPACGFCVAMTDQLKSWEEAPPLDAPDLVVVSTGTPEANIQMGLRSTTLLDEGFNVQRSFGAQGTPSAILIDGEGRIASGVSSGGRGVMELLGAKQGAQA